MARATDAAVAVYIAIAMDMASAVGVSQLFFKTPITLSERAL